jgi:hypothetical protein
MAQPQQYPEPPSRLERWILFYLLEREKMGLLTKGNDLLSVSDVEPLVKQGFVSITQSHDVPSLQNSIIASTVVSLTEQGRHYFER